MNKHTRWLQEEIGQWVSEGLVTPEQAAGLRRRYPVAEDAVPWGLLVFATAGAIVIGLGVILLIAYNWEDIPKAGKLALIFSAMLTAHAGGLRLLAGEGWRPRLGEALAVLGTMFYGAGIWLIAQLYHIEEHYPAGFMYWALGALAMAWAIRSTANGLLAVVLLALWGCTEAGDFRSPEYWPFLLVLGGIFPLAWKQRSALLLAAGLVATHLLLALSLGIWGEGAHALTASVALGVLWVALARLLPVQPAGFATAAPVLEYIGLLTFGFCAYLLSFHQAAGRLLDWSQHAGPDAWIASVWGWTLFAAALGGWLALAWQAFGPGRRKVNLEEWLLPVALIICHTEAALGSSARGDFISWCFNLVLLGLAARWMWCGCRESRMTPTVLGSLLLGLVVLARYFDLFQSQASRGAAFILLGVIFMGVALYYRKIRRAKGSAA